jgi:Zn-dependent alcohol dehydrogenase
VIGVDPVAFKRESALAFGATHVFASLEEALPAVQELTWGRMAHRVIVAPGVIPGEMLVDAMTLVGKGGTCVITGLAPITARAVSLNLFEVAMWNKEIKGTVFGSANPALTCRSCLACTGPAGSSWTSSSPRRIRSMPSMRASRTCVKATISGA